MFVKMESADQWLSKKFTILQSGDKTLIIKWKIWAKKWQTGVKTLVIKWKTGQKISKRIWEAQCQIVSIILAQKIKKMIKILSFLFEFIKNLMN